MADTYLRLTAYDLAAEVQRLRSRQAVTRGPPLGLSRGMDWPWLNIALGKNREAAKLIDATSILHPEARRGELPARNSFTSASG